MGSGGATASRHETQGILLRSESHASKINQQKSQDEHEIDHVPHDRTRQTHVGVEARRHHRPRHPFVNRQAQHPLDGHGQHPLDGHGQNTIVGVGPDENDGVGAKPQHNLAHANGQRRPQNGNASHGRPEDDHPRHGVTLIGKHDGPSLDGDGGPQTRQAHPQRRLHAPLSAG